MKNGIYGFTLGPHRADGTSVYGPDGLIAECGFGVRDDEEMRANAVLYASATELLAACEYAAHYMRRDWSPAVGADSYAAIRNTLINAINRAKCKHEPDRQVSGMRGDETEAKRSDDAVP